jgi:beta-phosphoglucomutase
LPKLALKAAEKLEVNPGDCLVIEDAENGVKAAKTAGMHCIGVHNKFNLEKLGLRQNLDTADRQVNSIEEISLKEIKELLNK